MDPVTPAAYTQPRRCQQSGLDQLQESTTAGLYLKLSESLSRNGNRAPLGQRPGPRLLIAGTSAREILAHRRCRPRPALHLDPAAVPPPGQLAEPGGPHLPVRQPDLGNDERLRERTRSLLAVLSSCRLTVHAQSPFSFFVFSSLGIPSIRGVRLTPGGVSLTGGGCQQDTRSGATRAVVPTLQNPERLPQTPLTPSGRRSPPIPDRPSSRRIRLDPLSPAHRSRTALPPS